MHTFSSVALIDARGRVLMQERDEHAPMAPDLWCLPGGGLEPGESYAVAARRELAEETGVRDQPLELLGRFRFHNVYCGGEDEFAVYWAQTELTDDDIVCGEGRRMVFVEPAEAARLPLIRAAEIGLAAVTGSSGYREAHGGPPVLLDGREGRRFAGVVLTDPQGRVLLQERDEHPRIDPLTWGLVGGHVEDGEEFLPAAYRELEEETGVKLPPGALTRWCEFAVDHLAAYGSVDRMQVFVAPTELTDADIDCREGRRIVFVEPGRIASLPLSRAASVILPALHEAGLPTARR